MSDDPLDLDLDGGCDCRFVRYRLHGPPLVVNCCHCRWCQRETGSSFALNAMIEADRVTLLEEEKIAAYYGAGTLYATPARQEPLL